MKESTVKKLRDAALVETPKAAYHVVYKEKRWNFTCVIDK
jgi:hypothetical protein